MANTLFERVGRIASKMASKQGNWPTPPLPLQPSFAECFPSLNFFIDHPDQQELQPLRKPVQCYASAPVPKKPGRSVMMEAGDDSTTGQLSLPIMGLDDFLRSNPAPPESLKQQTLQPSQHTKQQQQQQQHDEAIPISSGPKSSAATIKLHELCNRRGIQLDYRFEEFRPQVFGVTLTLRGLSGADRHIFTSPPHGDTIGHPNKQAAKEAVSKVALQQVEGELTDQPTITKQLETAAPESPAINWIGRLLEYAQAKGGPLPQFQEFAVGTQFSCEVSLGPIAFGGKTCTYPTKKAARAGAARIAIEYLESRGESTIVRSGKKQKTPHSGGSVGTSAEGDGHQPNYMMLVNEACQRMRIAQPRWHFEPHPSAPSFHSGGAYFADATLGVAPDEMVGEVRNVLGKKRAKAQSADEVYAFLMKVEQRRAAHGNA